LDIAEVIAKFPCGHNGLPAYARVELGPAGKLGQGECPSILPWPRKPLRQVEYTFPIFIIVQISTYCTPKKSYFALAIIIYM